MCVRAGAIASYYWAGGQSSKMPAFPVLVALKNTVVYHMGSIAFGAFVIAVIQFIRFLLDYLDRKSKDLQAANKCVPINQQGTGLHLMCLSTFNSKQECARTEYSVAHAVFSSTPTNRTCTALVRMQVLHLSAMCVQMLLPKLPCCCHICPLPPTHLLAGVPNGPCAAASAASATWKRL